VVAPGGSIIYLPELMESLKQKSALVFLDEDFDIIAARLTNARDRGIVGLKTRSLRQIFEERRPLYLKHADIVMKAGGKSRESVVAEIVTGYQQVAG
jgi:shikimate kinase